MTPWTDHAHADVRHDERYASPPERARGRSPRRRARRSPRRALGMLLVEAGLHLMTRGERGRALAPLGH